MRKLFTPLLVIFSLFIVSSAYAAFPIEYDEMLDITNKDAAFNLSENTLIVSMERSSRPMRPFTIQFHFNKNNVETLNLMSNMKMNMGNFRNTPKNIGYGNYVAEQTLPKCGSGDSLWYGKLDITYKSGKMDTIYFFYNLN